MSDIITFRVHEKTFCARQITVTESTHLIFSMAKALGRSIGEITEIPDFIAEKFAKPKDNQDDDGQEKAIIKPESIREILKFFGTLISGCNPDELMSLMRCVYGYASVEVDYRDEKPWFAKMDSDKIINKYLADFPLQGRFELVWEILKINFPEFSFLDSKKKAQEQ